MTTIAWDGQTLAADKRGTNSNLARTVTKIVRLHGALLGWSGSHTLGQELLRWYADGAMAEHFPTAQRDKDDWCCFIVIKPDRQVLVYERTPYPMLVEDPMFAAGSGRDFALAAMRCGRTAPEAVQIAAEFDIYTGGGVDTLTF